MDLYIYYRVRCEHAAELQSRVISMQTLLGKEYSLSPALKRKPDEKDTLHTWMEIYPNIPQNFDTILSNAVLQTGLAPLIEGERHIEYFLDISACA